MRKKLKILVALIAVIQTMIIGLYRTVYATEVVEFKNKATVSEKLQRTFDMHNAIKFEEVKDKYPYICQKIEDEKKQYTGKIGKEKEDKLNEYGILDIEIEALNSNDLQFIQSTPADELIIMSSVYECVKDEDGTSIARELSYNEINEVYEYEYKSNVKCGEISYEDMRSSVEEILRRNVTSNNIDREMSEVKSKGGHSSILNNQVNVRSLIGILKERVTPISSTVGDYVETRSTERFKKSIYGRMDKSKEMLYITFSTMWLTTPEQRLMDLITFKWDGMEYVSWNNCKVTHKVYKTDIYWHGTLKNGSYITTIDSYKRSWKTSEVKKHGGGLYGKIFGAVIADNVEVESEIYDVVKEGMCILVSLYNNTGTTNLVNGSSANLTGTTQQYDNETIVVEIELNIPSYETEFNFECMYYHFYLIEEKTYNYSAVVSAVVSAGGGVISPDKYGFAVGVVDALSTLVTSELVNVKNYLCSCIMGADFYIHLWFKYK